MSNQIFLSTVPSPPPNKSQYSWKVEGTRQEYGGLFWLNRNGGLARIPEDAYWAAGYMGQTTMIIPSRDMVVVRLGPSPSGYNPYLNEMVGRVLDSFGGS